MADFTAAKRWNYDKDELVEVTESSEMIYPVVIHTPDEMHAIGGYAHPDPNLYIEMRCAPYL